jgi:hypothetical protein
MVTTSLEICNLALARLGDISISAIDTTTKAGSLCNTLYAQLRDELLVSYPWSFARRSLPITDSMHFYSKMTITNIVVASTTADITTLTVSSTGTYVDVGQGVLIEDVVGMTQLNGNTYRVTSSTAAVSFVIEVPGPSTDYSTYVSGGTARIDTLDDVYDYAYRLPTDFLSDIRSANLYDYEIRQGNVLANPAYFTLWTNEEDLVFNYIAQVTEVKLFPVFFVRALAGKLAAELSWPLTQSQKVQEAQYAIFQGDFANAKRLDGYQGNRSSRLGCRWLDRRRGNGTDTRAHIVRG